MTDQQKTRGAPFDRAAWEAGLEPARRAEGAALPKAAHVRFEVLEPEKRPVMADADSRSPVPGITHRLLFDPGHGLEERLIGEQFI